MLLHNNNLSIYHSSFHLEREREREGYIAVNLMLSARSLTASDSDCGGCMRMTITRLCNTDGSAPLDP